MKIHLVFDKNYSFVGTLHDKLDVDLFKKQRDMNYFKVESMSMKEITKKFGHIEELNEREAVNTGNHIMFPEEEIYMYASLEQMKIDFTLTMEYMLRDASPYVKFTREEFDTVTNYMREVYYLFNPTTDDDVDEETEYEVDDSDDTIFNTYLLERDILRQFAAII